MQRTQRAINLFAVILMLGGPILPLAVDFGVEMWISHLIQTDPVPQNAMLLGFLGFVASLAIGVAIFGTGLSLLIWNIRRKE